MFPAVYALSVAREAERETRAGAPGWLAPAGIRTGRVSAWITIALSGLTVAAWVLSASVFQWI